MLEKLRQIMPLPTNPVEASTWEAWTNVQTEPGTHRPADYKHFINT